MTRQNANVSCDIVTAISAHMESYNRRAKTNGFIHSNVKNVRKFISFSMVLVVAATDQKILQCRCHINFTSAVLHDRK